MAEKTKNITDESLALAKAIASMVEQKQAKGVALDGILPDWKAGEALTAVRYMALDALDEIARKLPLPNGFREAYSARLKEVYCHSSMVEQANMKKQLQAAGIVAATKARIVEEYA